MHSTAEGSLVDLQLRWDSSRTRHRSEPPPTSISAEVFLLRHVGHSRQLIALLTVPKDLCELSSEQSCWILVVLCMSHRDLCLMNSTTHNGFPTSKIWSVSPPLRYFTDYYFFSMGAVETETTITFDGNASPIPMASTFTGGGLDAVVSGWGGTAVTGGPAPNNLQWVATTTLTNEDCRSRHTVGNSAFVFDHKICTFTMAGQGICQGDSGGPLVVANHVVGTVSWNIPCARGFPGN